MTKQKQHGGQREGAGRPKIYGKAVRKTVYLGIVEMNYLLDLGEGNLSRGITLAVHSLQYMDDLRQEAERI